jgi:ankyrin repeat protein
LIKSGADVSAAGKDGGTALMLAATSGDAEIVKELLSAGANVAGRYTSNGETALVLAKRAGHDDIAQLLAAAERAWKSNPSRTKE